MLFKQCALKGSDFQAFEISTIAPNDIQIDQNLGSHLVIWHVHPDLPKGFDLSIYNALTRVEPVIPGTDACENICTMPQFTPLLPALAVFKAAMDACDTFDALCLSENFRSALRQFQTAFYNHTDIGHVIHMYGGLEVNRNVAVPIDRSILDFNYHKFLIHCTAFGGAYLFFPSNRDIAVTPLHSHATTQIMVAPYHCYETAIEHALPN